MHTHPQRMIFGEHRAQLRRDALRQKNRNPRADAKKLDVLNRPQSRKQLVDLVVAENESIPTTQEYVAHFCVCFEISERFLEICVQFLFANSADHTAPGAVTAVTRAAIGDQKQDAVGIPVH